MAERIEVLKVKSEWGGTHYTVIIDGLLDNLLGADEVLGAVASALFGPADKRPMYMRTYEEWLAFEKRYRGPEYSEPVALIPAKL